MDVHHKNNVCFWLSLPSAPSACIPDRSSSRSTASGQLTRPTGPVFPPPNHTFQNQLTPVSCITPAIRNAKLHRGKPGRRKSTLSGLKKHNKTKINPTTHIIVDSVSISVVASGQDRVEQEGPQEVGRHVKSQREGYALIEPILLSPHHPERKDA